MLFLEKPKIFNQKFEVSSCFLEYDNTILLLERQDYKAQGGTWGMPAGKMHGGEAPEVAAVRELLEETGYNAKLEETKFLYKTFVNYEEYGFVYYIFYIKLYKQPDIKINSEEHKSFKWVKPIDALKMNLIQDLDACIKLFYKL